MPDKETGERKSIGEVSHLRARAAKLERISRDRAKGSQVDEELDKAWTEWETTFDAIQDSIMLLDGDFNVVQANAASSRFFVRPLDEIIGNKCCRLVHGTDEPPEGCPLSKIGRTKKRHKAELYIREKDIWAVASVDPILDEQGNMTGAVHTLRDITDRKKAEEALRESEEHFRNIFENAVLGLYRTTPDGRILMANPALIRMLGYASFGQLARRNQEDEGFAPEYPRSTFKERIEADGRIVGLESAWTRRDDTKLFVRENAKAVRDAQGNTLYYEGTVEDITERRKAEDQILRQAQVLEAINKVLREVLTCDTDIEVAQTCLNVAEELTGSKFGFIGELNKAGLFDTIALSNPGWKACKMPHSEATRSISNMQIRGIWGLTLREKKSQIVNGPASHHDRVGTPDGHPLITCFLGVPLRQKGETIGMIALANKESGYDLADRQDIEALSVSFVEALMRKRAEQQVRQSEQKYKELFESASEAIIIMDLNGKITDVNRTVEEYGFTKDHLFGKSIFDFIPANHRARAAKDLDELCHGTPVKGEMEVIAPKGNLTVEYRDNPIVRGGQIVAVQAILMDITERKKAQEKIKLFSDAIASAFDCFLLTDEKGNITYVNEPACKTFGYAPDEFLKLNITRLDADPAFAKKITQDVTTKGKWSGEVINIRKNGETFCSLLSAFIIRDDQGNPRGTMGILKDITARKKAEDQSLRQAQVLEAINKVLREALTCDTHIEVAQTCLRMAEELTGSKFGFIGELNEAGLFDTIALSNPGWQTCKMPHLEATRSISNMRIRGIWGSVLREERSRIVNDPGSHPDRVGTPEGHPPITCFLGVPLRQMGKTIGMIGLANKPSGYDAEDQQVIETLSVAFVEALMRKRATQALLDYQTQLKTLTSELALAEERERRRIAAGIHDDIGQKLALAKMELQLLAGPPGKSRIPASLDSICSRIDEAIEDAHSLTFELSNPALYDLSFEAAIDLWLLEQIQKKHGIKCTVIAGEQAVVLDENSKVVLFRALRELAVNVVKHAKATALTVAIEKLENAVQITCKDDGLGFTPPEDNALPRDVGGFGLFNIKERLEHLGGGMKLQSAPGRGTLITLSLPLERQNDADEGRQ